MRHGIKASDRRAVAGCIAALAAALGAMVGCRGERTDKPPRQFFPDMDTQPKAKSQDSSGFFADGRSMRAPVRGTVPFGWEAWVEPVAGVDFAKRRWLLKEDEAVFTGQQVVEDADGNPVKDAGGSVRTVYVERTPIEAILGVKRSDPAFPDRYTRFLGLGEKKFNIYCSPCHGYTGDGKGTVGTRWSYPLPSWFDAQYQRGGEKGTDGFFFHTIRHGVPNVGEAAPYPLKMPAYASKIREDEAWAIVEYLRVLQKAASAPLQSVPERERQELERTRGATPQADAGSPREEGSS